MWFTAPLSPSSLTCGPHPSTPLTECQSMGTQERMKRAFPAAMETPESTTGTPRPHTRFQEKPVGLATAAR